MGSKSNHQVYALLVRLEDSKHVRDPSALRSDFTVERGISGALNPLLHGISCCAALSP